jgi:hypothetical protein
VSQNSVSSQIHAEVSSWPGVSVEGHHGGMVFFRIGRREIGHLHGNRFADVPFPVRIRRELVASGKAELHYLHPESGWVTHPIRGEQDVESILQLFRLNYHRPWLQRVN